MELVDVIPFGDRQFLVQIFSIPTIPDGVGFNRYYEATCEIVLTDGNTIQLECVVHRPANRRNVVGDRRTDWLILLIKTDVSQRQLCQASINVVGFGAEISELEAIARRNQK